MDIGLISSSTIQILWKSRDGNTVSSGSSFFCNGFLITNNHIFAGPTNCDVHLLRYGDVILRMDGTDFSLRLKTGSHQDQHDFAVLKFPELERIIDRPLNFGDPDKLALGTEIILAGYPFGKPNLCLHRGHVSSLYKSGVANWIQIDASVNVGNSGGPLIEVGTGQVVGLVTRKATGLTDSFAQMRKVVQENISAIRVVRNQGGLIIMAGIDPLEAIEVAQVQMLHTMNEIERSANVGIGYAFSIKTLMQESCFSS